MSHERCAVVDWRGRVVAIIRGDRVLDTIKGHDLVTCSDDHVKIGDIYDRAQARFIKVKYRLIAEPAVIGVRTI